METSDMRPRCDSFRQRLRLREALVGTFSKTPSPIVHEVLAISTLDCVCIDAEHAPFGRLELDSCVAALRAGDMPSIVRIPTLTDEHILQALDSGASGVMVPHVSNEEMARAAAAAATFGGTGHRGYAGSTRAARYTQLAMREHIEKSNAARAVIAQIEDAAALAKIDAIAAVDAIDCLFVGRADLTVSLGASSVMDSKVIEAVSTICRAGQRAGKAIGMYCPAGEDLAPWRALGASLFLLSSDQSFLLDGARALTTPLR
jgi:2-keto-3-deoxy-L-rhamnonate aldolase RhmA